VQKVVETKEKTIPKGMSMRKKSSQAYCQVKVGTAMVRVKRRGERGKEEYDVLKKENLDSTIKQEGEGGRYK